MKNEVKKKKTKKDIRKIMLKVLLVLLAIDVIFIPLFIYAEVKPMVGMSVFIFFPLVLAICVVLLSRSCVISYEQKKKLVEEKMK